MQPDIESALNEVARRIRRAMTEPAHLASPPWTQADDDKLRRLALTGLSSRAIGIRMNRTTKHHGRRHAFLLHRLLHLQNGKWRGELITQQHAEAIGVNLLFGGREVTCGFTGVYSDDEAEVD